MTSTATRHMPLSSDAPPALREVKFDYTPTLRQILEHAGVSLLVSTYQAGKLVVLGTHAGKLTVAVRNFDRAMGVAVASHAIAVGCKRQVHLRQPAERREELRCGVAVVDLISGQAVAKFEFQTGVEEIFAIEVLPRTRNPALFGPSPDEDQQRDVWIVPPEGRTPPVATGDSPVPYVRQQSERAIAAVALAHASGWLKTSTNHLETTSSLERNLSCC